MSFVSKNKQPPSWPLWWFVSVIAIVTPLVYSSVTVDITLAPQFLVLAAGLFISIVFLFFVTKQQSFSFYITPLFVSLMGCFVFSASSILGAVNKNEGCFELLRTGLWILLIICCTNILIKNRSALPILFKAFTISSFALSFIGICQLSGLLFTKLPGHVIPFGTLGNRNIFVPSLLMTLPFALYQSIFSLSRWRMFAIVAVSLNLIVILFSGMRASVAALLLALVIAFVVILLNPRTFGIIISERKMKFFKLFLLVSFSTVLIVSVFTLVFFKDHSRVKKVLNLNSANERVALWKNSVLMFKDHPLNGVGAGNWKIMLPHYGLSELPPEARRGEMNFQRPENDFLWTLAETGIMGFAAYAGVFIFAFSMIIRQIKEGKTVDDKIRMLLMLVGLVFYSIIALVGFPKERSFLSAEFGIVLAVIAAQHYSIAKPKKSFKIHSFIYLFFFFVFIYFGQRWLRGELYTKKIIDARAESRHEDVIAYCDKATDLNYLLDPSSTPIAFYRGVACFSLGRNEDALMDFKTAQSIHPYHIHVLSNLATCYSAKGDSKKAIQYLDKAIAISPTFADALIGLAGIYFNGGNTAKASETIAKVKEGMNTPYFSQVRSAIDKGVNDSLMNVAMRFYKSGNLDKASEALSKCRRCKDPEFVNFRIKVEKEKRSIALKRK